MKASIYIATSVDGFIARPNGDIDWLFCAGKAEESTDFGYMEFASSVDAMIMGRITFEKALSFGDWPYGEKRVVVLTKTLNELPSRLPDAVEISALSPKAILARLEADGVTHAYVDGGKTIQSFFRDGLIDEMIVTRIPILIGEGIPLFGALERDIRLNHIFTKSFSNGLTQTKYAVHYQQE
jgi:dihydrofolate reductase